MSFWAPRTDVESLSFIISAPFLSKLFSVIFGRASIGKGYPFRKNHSFLSATIREIFACWEYPKPLCKSSYILLLNSPPTLINTNFSVSEFSLMSSLVLYHSI